jgi:microcompartment protein CcmK/EutM
MFLSKVKGSIISSHKNNYLSGHKLLLTHPVNLKGELIGNSDLISLDLIDAGIGDTVLVVNEGDAVQQILGHCDAPVNSMIIAIVDDLEIQE